MAHPPRFVLLALIALLLPSSARVGQLPIADQPISLSAEAIPLNPLAPDETRIGALEYLGGWILRARHADFGGWSAMISRGRGLRLVSDAGGVLDIADANKRPLSARLSDLPSGCGRRWNKDLQDAEALTADPATGRWWISLEKLNIICRIDKASTVRVIARPEMARWPSATGGEAMLRLNDGRFLMFAEADPVNGDGPSPVLLFQGDPVNPDTRAVQMRLVTPPGFRAVEAAQLPDGRVLILLRDFKMPVRWRSRIIALDLATLRAGARLIGTEIARLESPRITDNFEAMAVTQEKRRTIIWLASDDNFWPLQETYLLKFALKD